MTPPAETAAVRELPLEAFLRQARDLYTMPAVAAEVLTLADDPRIDAGRLKHCIERDPALTIKLLRVVNSSMFGLARPVSDLSQAIALLGVKPLKLLVLGFCLPDRLFAAKGSTALRQYWTRTLTRAVAARELARIAGARNADEAFTAGLLADLGQLVLMQEKGEAYLRAFHHAQRGTGALAAAERETFGFDHLDLTARLLTEWRLPAALVQAVEYVRHAELPAGDALVAAASGAPLPPPQRVVRFAARLATLLVDERADLWPAAAEEAFLQFHLTTETLVALADTIQSQVDQLAQVLKVELAGGLGYRETMERAAALMRVTAEDAVGELVRGAPPAKPRKLRDEETVVLGELVELKTQAQQAAVGASPRRPQAGELPPAASTTTGCEPRSTADAPPATEVPVGSASAPAMSTKPADLTTLLTAAVAECRQCRAALSLLLVELDQFADLAERFGPLWAQHMSATIAEACTGGSSPKSRLVRLSEGKFAVIMPRTDRMQALEATDEIVARFRAACPADETGGGSLSFGVATVHLPPRNFAPADLLTAAERCLYAAAQAAGDTTKSIEIF